MRHILVCLLVLVACYPKNNSQPKTVEIPQTEVRNQGGAGICWAYAAVALVESLHKKRTSEELNMSEEALAFYSFREKLARLRTGESGSQFAKTVEEMLGTPEGRAQFEANFLLEAPFLVSHFGLIPESAWPGNKFETPEEMNKALSILKARLLKFVQVQKNFSRATIQDIENLLVGPGQFTSVPPTHFTYKNTKTSAVDFVKNVLKFNHEDYRALMPAAVPNLNASFALVKKALAQGFPVPMIFPIDDSLIKNSVFFAKKETKALQARGSHIVLIVDFKNRGGSWGKASQQTLKAELEKPGSELALLKVKNSWGKGLTRDERGTVVDGSADGYYYIDISYLHLAVRHGVNFLIPKSIGQ